MAKKQTAVNVKKRARYNAKHVRGKKRGGKRPIIRGKSKAFVDSKLYTLKGYNSENYDKREVGSGLLGKIKKILK